MKLTKLILPISLIVASLFFLSCEDDQWILGLSDDREWLVVTLEGDSMEPSIKDGSRLLVWLSYKEEDLQVGEVVVVWNRLVEGGKPICHRIVAVKEGKGGLLLRTKGDGNKDVDWGWVKEDLVVGIVKKVY